MFKVNEVRPFFPALQSRQGASAPVFFDAVGGTQVPQGVVDAISEHLIMNNGNKGGVFPTSCRTDTMLSETRSIVADFINADDPAEIVFGANFTSLCFHASRTLAQTWIPGDEVILSRLDHDANVSPWVLAARDAGVTVKYVDILEGSCLLDMQELESLLCERTRLVAVCAGSSSIGTIVDIAEVTRMAHRFGALVFVDAVAFAPHAPIDVKAWGADFVGFSAYKFFGPHVGFLWGKRDLLQALPVYKIRPAPEVLPDRWMNGAQPYELLAGAKAALEYLAHLGRQCPEFRSQFPQFTGRRLEFKQALAAIQVYETSLCGYFIRAMLQRREFTLWGITDPRAYHQRLPVIALSLGVQGSNTVARYLGDLGIYIWSRSVYSISLSERLGLERTGGFLRVGIAHYNTHQELDLLVSRLDEYEHSTRHERSSGDSARKMSLMEGEMSTEQLA